MKNALMILGGVLLGTALTVFVTTRKPVAVWYSQAIYDCGIKVSDGVTGGKISGFTIVGHEMGYCQDGSDTTVEISGVAFNDDTRAWLLKHPLPYVETGK